MQRAAATMSWLRSESASLQEEVIQLYSWRTKTGLSTHWLNRIECCARSAERDAGGVDRRKRTLRRVEDTVQLAIAVAEPRTTVLPS